MEPETRDVCDSVCTNMTRIAAVALRKLRASGVDCADAHALLILAIDDALNVVAIDAPEWVAKP